jgi:HAD superfamily hydrolase (TIGR01509 family)
MPRKYQYIFFDVGSTLLFANRERMLEPLYDRGFRPPETQLRALEAQIKNDFDAAMEHGAKPDHGLWDLFYQRLFQEIGLRDEALRQQVIANTRDSMNWNQIPPGTRETLQQIGENYGLAVISNADGRIAELLARCGIADCFQTITDSGIIGHEKPHPVIFATALASMQARPEESLYVGDVYSVDYRGATGAGMDAVLFDVCGAYREKGLPRVESLAQLVSILG